MKTLLVALALVIGCGSTAETPRCELGRSAACTCSSGAVGAQECGPSGVWSPCVCTAPVDAGSDAAVVADARADAADVPRDADPRCARFATETTWCEVADAGVCVDLQRDPRNCGRCGMACNGGYECFGGFCFVRPADAGRD